MRGTLLLIDGNALVHRAFHAVPPLTTSKGELVNAVYGFASMLFKVFAELKPEYAAVAFDRAAPTFRHLEYERYKSQRVKVTDGLYEQFGRVHQLIRALSIPIFEVEGYEADDILGTLAQQASERGLQTVIVTGDNDALQLVGPLVKVITPRRGFSDTITYDEETVRQRYGIDPHQLPDFKALTGDPSDNIPGVSGVGEKTASKLVGQFGSLRALYEHLPSIEARLRAKLEQQREQAFQGLRLVTIVRDVPIELDLAACRFGQYNRSELMGLLRDLEFRSLVDKLPPSDLPAERQTGEVKEASAVELASQMILFESDGLADSVESAGPSDTQPDEATPAATVCEPLGNYSIVTTVQQLDDLVQRLLRSPGFVVDLETTSKDAMRADLVGLAFAHEIGSAFYVPVGHRAEAREGNGSCDQLPIEMVLEHLKPVLEDATIPKYAHNGKYESIVLRHYGVQLRGLAFDTMLATYLLESTQRALNLKDLAWTRLGVEMTPITHLIGKGKGQITMAEVPVASAAAYAGADADMTLRLTRLLEPELQRSQLWNLMHEVELPLLPVLAEMEHTGVAVDVDYLLRMSADLQRSLRDLEQNTYAVVGHRFNINSTQQLASVLFEELKLPAVKRTKTGFSTDVAVLEELRGAHPIVQLVLDYRQLAKLKSTYVDALPLMVNPKTGRVHTSFNQTGTETGRLSSSEPNLQNIPARTDLGREVRQAFVAGRPDHVLLAADYSQIELRILAHITEDPKLLASFAAEEDIHAATAAEVFSVPKDQVTGEMRRFAKIVNFGIIYGMSDYGLSTRAGISRQQASEFIGRYIGKYPRVWGYLEQMKRQAERQGYVSTLLGRRRYLPEINSPNRQVKLAAERTAINMPIQGTAADIIKLAMIDLQRQIEEHHRASRLILQVHDELVLEVPRVELDEMRQVVRQTMENAMPTISVPLKVEVKVGDNWRDLRPV